MLVHKLKGYELGVRNGSVFKVTIKEDTLKVKKIALAKLAYRLFWLCSCYRIH